MTGVSKEKIEMLLLGRGYIAQEIEGDGPTAGKVIGLQLVGPRRNSQFLEQEPHGGYSMEKAELWCDGVDYASDKLAARKMLEGRRK